MSFNIAKTEYGWIVNKDNQSYAIVDKNTNGKFDNDDLCKSLSGNSNTLSANELTEIKFNILSASEEGMTATEMVQFNNWQTQQKKQAALQKQQNTTLNKPKKGFWDKFCTIATPILGGINSVLGLLNGYNGYGNSWAFNCTPNDFAIQANGALNNSLLNLSTMYASGGLYGNNNDIVSQITQANEEHNNKLQEILSNIQLATETNNKEEKAKQEKTAAVSGIDTLYNSVGENQDEKHMIESNYKKLDDMHSISKEEYTDEEISAYEKIKQYPHVPIDHISEKTGNEVENNKLSQKLATAINQAMEKYKNANESVAQDINAEGDYTKLVALLKKDALTPDDIKQIEKHTENIMKK